MSSKDNPCRKFQANIFNKSKCQNCFKPRESHLLSDEDLNQAKPIYGGWLLLAPEGTCFENPAHRSRKWQRRFFILYEHGSLRYALDEMPSTLPQGTINMNLCCDVVDGELRTGQRNCLCILMPGGELFIRAENKEVINGWQETLVVYPRTNKQNQKKKRKVEPPTREPGPAKVAVSSSSSSMASLEKGSSNREGVAIPLSRSASCASQPHSVASERNQGPVSGGRKKRVESGYFSLEKAKPDSQPLKHPQELALSSPSGTGVPPRYRSHGTDPLVSPHSLSSGLISTSESSLESEAGSTTPPSWDGPSRTGRATRAYATLADVPRAKRLSNQEAFRAEKKRLEQRARSPGREEVARLFGLERRRSLVIEKFEALEGDNGEYMETSAFSEPASITTTRQGRSGRRKKQELSLDVALAQSMPDVSSSSLSNLRRAKSLDRRVTESSMTPDLLNFKKGWLTKLVDGGVWKKHWFVLKDQSLGYYRDSVAEEAANLDGEIDLSTCYDVTEFQVPRNYGFQIHTNEGVFTLCAMTSGIRRNWIQAIMKNVRPTIAPDVTRKNISLKMSVLKTSSLPEEKAEVRAVMGSGAQRPAECPGAEVQTHTDGPSNSELRRSRIRDRRREGRYKTFDWADFRHRQSPGTGESDRQPERGVEAGDASSTSSPFSSSVTSPASSASSPLVAPFRDPAPGEELDKERKWQLEERRQSFQTPPADAPFTTLLPHEDRDKDNRKVSTLELSTVSRGGPNKPPEVQVAIERRWHQVETTPVCEERQVPISNSSPSDPAAESPPPQLVALQGKELMQTQKELTRLQEQNSILQEQLHESRGLEQSARDGYVLQSESSPSSSPAGSAGACQHVHKPSQDLQYDFEAQRCKQDPNNQQMQALKRDHNKATEAICRHEVEITALQDKLNGAMAEVLVREQALARMRSELKLEQERFQESREEWERNEQTLRAQLKDSEERLKEFEAYLLEKSQALRDLEQQQALKRDHVMETQRLQDKLSEVTGQLIATEEAQTLREERLKKHLGILQESQEKERETLAGCLAEAEGKMRELEHRLQEAEEQVQTLLKEKRPSGLEGNELVCHLEEQLANKVDTIAKLEEEKGQLICRCEELLNQIADADSEVSKLQSRLKTQETQYYNLEHSCEKISEEFQAISRVLQEKEEEIQKAKEMYERLVEKKEQDLNEALVKMAALGSSLEETELRLQVKEELISKSSQVDVEMHNVDVELQIKLADAEDHITRLERHLSDLQLSYADLQMQHGKLQEGCMTLKHTSKQAESLSGLDPTLTLADARPKNSSDIRRLLNKQQSICFSEGHLQKYEGVEKQWTSSNSTEISQDGWLSLEMDASNPFYECIASDGSDPEKFLSVIHTLETKLYATEQKLKEITLRLGEQQSQKLESVVEVDGQWAGNEMQLHSQLSESLAKVYQLTARLQEETDYRSAFAQETDCRITAVNALYEKALACVESCREKVQAILKNHKHGSTETELHTLSDVETELLNATVYIRLGGNSLEDQQRECQGTLNHELSENHVCYEDRVKLVAKTLAFEALVLNKMAYSIQNPNIDILQGLSEIHQEAEKISDEGHVAILYADLLARKLMLESEFWTEMEKLEKRYDLREDECRNNSEMRVTEAGETKVCSKEEQAIQNLKLNYKEKIQKLQGDLLQAQTNLQCREFTLREIVKGSKVHEISEELGFSPKRTLADISPPELAPYIEQIEMEDARDIAEDIVSKHLQRDLTPCRIDYVDSPHVGRERLGTELMRQAEVLQRLSQDIGLACEPQRKILHLGPVDACLANPCENPCGDITGGSLCLHEEMIQAQIAQVACRLKADRERDLKQCREDCRNMEVLCQEHARNVAVVRGRYEASLRKERRNFAQVVSSLREENIALRVEVSQHIAELSRQQGQLTDAAELHQQMEELEARHKLELSQAEQRRAETELSLMERTAESQRKLEIVLLDLDRMEDRHEEQALKLEKGFQMKIQELQRIHEEEMERLHGHYTETTRALQETLDGLKPQNPRDPAFMETLSSHLQPAATYSKVELDSMVVLRERIQELETQVNTRKEEMVMKPLEGDISTLKEEYQQDLENLKATCERGFTAMEETHQKVIEDIQRQHQREVAKLLEERERLLAEETAATIAAIEAMKNAHREDLEKAQRSQLSGASSDIDEIRQQYEEELQSIHRELEVLSEQYSQKCLENSHLAQALEAERHALRQCQRENQELNAHNQELNNRLSEEISRIRSCLSGEVTGNALSKGKDLYELEVFLRVKESEIQYLKQEIHSLKDELQSVLRDKKYASDKHKDIYRELSIVKAKADCDISRLQEQLTAAMEALGERTAQSSLSALGYDIIKSKSNPDFLKKDRSPLTRQIRGARSKSLKEGLTVQERMKLFEPRDTQKM